MLEEIYMDDNVGFEQKTPLPWALRLITFDGLGK